MQDSSLKAAFRIALPYALLGLLWFTLSSLLLTSVVHDFDLLARSVLLHGWVSVIGAGAIHYVLIRRQVQAQLRAEEALVRSQESAAQICSCPGQSLANELRRAVERQELAVYYQPIVDLQQGSVLGAEALVRWNHPERGLLGPNQFIPLAEETGLILPIGRWVLKEACRQAQDWNRRYMLPNGFYMSVNIAASELQEPGVVERIRDCLKVTGLNPHRLHLEITESTTLGDLAQSLHVLNGIKALGVQLAMDDFGTGYSSLSYLRQLPVDVLKIDRTFVNDLGAKGEAIVRAIIAVGQALQLDLVAEGVETAEQAAKLVALGCLSGQGHHYYHPLPPLVMESLLHPVTAADYLAASTARAGRVSQS